MKRTTKAGISGTTAAIVATLLSWGAHAVDLSNRDDYREAHRRLAQSVASELAQGGAANRLTAMRMHRRELALDEICGGCAAVEKSLALATTLRPGAWLYEPSQRSRTGDNETLVAFVPHGDEQSWTHIEAIDLHGHWKQLDPRVPPSFPVVVVRINGSLSLRKQIELANLELKAAGLQQDSSAALAKGSGRWTTRLDMISLRDDHEPWISGAAEMYAITSGVLPGNLPQIQIVDLPYLDYDAHTYYPRQVVLDWAHYSYAVANIQFYEHDDNTNYQTLVTALVQAVGAGGSLAGHAEITAIAEIANRIVQAMPAGWFSNDDDYVDSLYSVEKRASGRRSGVSGNVQVELVPYELPMN